MSATKLPSVNGSVEEEVQAERRGRSLFGDVRGGQADVTLSVFIVE
jgi:hypothetical protein